MPLKTEAGWHESKLDLSQYLQVGDEVDDGIYWYVLECLPPACMSGRCVQLGEPMNHTADGRPTFITLTRQPGEPWKYAGVMPTPAGERCWYED